MKMDQKIYFMLVIHQSMYVHVFLVILNVGTL